MPLFATGYGVVYNLPSIPSSSRLILDRLSIFRILNRQITQWNDTLVQALNPALTLSGEITVAIPSEDENFVSILGKLLQKFNSQPLNENWYDSKKQNILMIDNKPSPPYIGTIKRESNHNKVQ